MWCYHPCFRRWALRQPPGCAGGTLLRDFAEFIRGRPYYSVAALRPLGVLFGSVGSRPRTHGVVRPLCRPVSRLPARLGLGTASAATGVQVEGVDPRNGRGGAGLCTHRSCWASAVTGDVQPRRKRDVSTCPNCDRDCNRQRSGSHQYAEHGGDQE